MQFAVRRGGGRVSKGVLGMSKDVESDWIVSSGCSGGWNGTCASAFLTTAVFRRGKSVEGKGHC